MNVITRCISFYLLESMLHCWSDLPCWILFEWTGPGHDVTWAWHINLIIRYADLAQWIPTWFGKYFCILCCSERMIWIFCMLDVSTGPASDLRLPTYWITTDPLFYFIAKVLYIILHIMVWLFEFFAWIVLCSASTLYSSSDGATASRNFCWIIESQPLDHDFEMCPHHYFA